MVPMAIFSSSSIILAFPTGMLSFPISLIEVNADVALLELVLISSLVIHSSSASTPCSILPTVGLASLLPNSPLPLPTKWNGHVTERYLYYILCYDVVNEIISRFELQMARWISFAPRAYKLRFIKKTQTAIEQGDT